MRVEARGYCGLYSYGYQQQSQERVFCMMERYSKKGECVTTLFL